MEIQEASIFISEALQFNVFLFLYTITMIPIYSAFGLVYTWDSYY